jgi:hypothetical protein
VRWSIFFCASLYHLPSASWLIWLIPHVFKIHLRIFLSHKITGYRLSLPFMFLEWRFAHFPIPSIYATNQADLIVFNSSNPTGHVMHQQFNL